MLKKALFLLLHVSLVPFLVREILQRRRVTIILYHRVSPDLLDRHLTVLGRHYNFLSLPEYLRIRSGRDPGQAPKKALVVTLDDGHAGNRGLLPVLKKHGVRCTIFVCTGIVGSNRHFWFLDPAAHGEIRELTRVQDEQRLSRLKEEGFTEDREYPVRQALSWEEMAEMKDWVDFQPHTRFHPILPQCSRERAETEIRQSKADLEQREFLVSSFAYPNGDYSERDVSLVQDAGYDCALTVDLGFNTMNTDKYRLKRIGINDESGTIEVLVRASGLWSAMRILVRGRP